MLKDKYKNKGFVILYAVIITTVVLIVGVSLMNIMTKQLVLSSISRNAKISYYAAQAGRDCAEFWKTNYANGGLNHFGGIFRSEEGEYYFSTPDENATTIKCIGYQSADQIEITRDPYQIYNEANSPPTPIYGSNFEFTINIGSGPNSQKACAKVRVETQDGNNGCEVSIVSDGYNISCADYNDPTKRPPRLVKSTYKNTCD